MKPAIYAFCAIFGALLIAGVQTLRLSSARAELADQRRVAAEAVSVLSADYLDLQQENRHAMAQAETRAHDQLAAARTAAARAHAAGERVQHELSAYLASWRSAAAACAAAGDCAPDERPAELLADLQRRADARAGELAALADDSRTRGLACERHYSDAQVMIQKAAAAAKSAAP